MPKKRKNKTGVPDYEIDSIARVLYSSIITYCNSEQGKKDYAEWKRQQATTECKEKANQLKL